MGKELFVKICKLICIQIVIFTGWPILVNAQTIEFIAQRDFTYGGETAYGEEVEVEGDYMYVAGGGTFDVFDISNPASPDSIASYHRPVHLEDLYVENNIAYFGDGYSSTRGTLTLFDVSNPYLPDSLSQIATSSSRNAKSIFVDGNYTYVPAASFEGVRIINTSNPSMPFIAGNIDLWAVDIYVKNNYAYLCTSTDGLHIYDVSTLSSPDSVGSIGGLGYLTDIDIDKEGQYAYLINYWGGSTTGFSIVNISDPTAPSIVSQYPVEISTGNSDIKVDGDYAFITTTSGLMILDISNPASPSMFAHIVGDPMSGAQDIEIEGDYVYIASASEVLIYRFIPPRPPETPTLISPDDDTTLYDNTPLLVWSSVEETDEYQIMLDNDSLFTSPEYGITTTSSQWTVNSSLSDGVYFWRVRAGNDVGWSDWSEIRKFSILNPPNPPALTSPENGGSTADLLPTFYWNSISGVDNYEIEIDNNSNFSSPERSNTVINNYWTVSPELTEGTWYWRIRAHNDAGWGEWSGGWTLYIVGIPPAPILVSPINDTTFDNHSPALDWYEIAGVDFYNVEIDDNSDFSSPERATSVDSSEWSVSPELAEGIWYWRIRAHNLAGWGDWSTTWHFNVLDRPEPPLLVSPADYDSSYVNGVLILDWTDLTSIIEYEVEVDDTSDYSSIDRWYNTAITQWSITPLLPSGTWYWRVRAKNLSGWGDWSNSNIFVILDYSTISGNIIKCSDMNVGVLGVSIFGIKSGSGDTISTAVSDSNGYYLIDGLVPESYTITPSLNIDNTSVSVADIIKTRLHLANLEIFDTPCKLIAGDVNCSGGVSVADIIKMRRYLAHLEELPCGNWTFIDSSYNLNMTNWPSAPRLIEKTIVDENIFNATFLGICMGDVNNTWNPAQVAKPSSAIEKSVLLQDAYGMPGDNISIPCIIEENTEVAGFEFHLKYDTDHLVFSNVTSKLSSEFTVNAIDDAIHIVWEDIDNTISTQPAKPVLLLNFNVKDNFEDEAEIAFTHAEVADVKGETYNLQLYSGNIIRENSSTHSCKPAEYRLEQNRPNPFNPTTEIQFSLPEACNVRLEVFNMLGQRVQTLVNDRLEVGYHTYSWNAGNFASGIYFTRLRAGTFIDTKKMILLK